MAALRQPILRQVLRFENETATHVTVRLACFHQLVLEFPPTLSPDGYKKFLAVANVDCHECAP